MSGFVFYRGDQFPEYQGDAFQCLWNVGVMRRLRFSGANGDQVQIVEDSRLIVGWTWPTGQTVQSTSLGSRRSTGLHAHRWRNHPDWLR